MDKPYFKELCEALSEAHLSAQQLEYAYVDFIQTPLAPSLYAKQFLFGFRMGREQLGQTINITVKGTLSKADIARVVQRELSDTLDRAGYG